MGGGFGVGVEERQTDRLVLRRITEADLPALVAIHTDPANYTHRPDEAREPRRAAEIVRQFIANWARDGIGYWTASTRDPEELVGVCGVSQTVIAGHVCWNLYYRFVAAARGRGLAGEAVREAVAVGAAIAPERPVLVRTRPGNEPARRLAERLGLERRPTLDADGFVAYLSPTS